jgi:hypothetical protein
VFSGVPLIFAASSGPEPRLTKKELEGGSRAGILPGPNVLRVRSCQANALEVAGINLQNLVFDDAREKIVGLSSDQISFNH